MQSSQNPQCSAAASTDAFVEQSSGGTTAVPRPTCCSFVAPIWVPKEQGFAAVIGLPPARGIQLCLAQ